MLTTSVDDDWGEGEALPAPKYICTAIVTKDYIPETNDHLTLILDDLVRPCRKLTPTIAGVCILQECEREAWLLGRGNEGRVRYAFALVQLTQHRDLPCKPRQGNQRMSMSLQ